MAAVVTTLCWLLSLLNLLDPANAIVNTTPDRTTSLHNANHIFNAIHSSMRQWGSSWNHNGMSFFLAAVPEGAYFYHGTHQGLEPVNGTQWLAFEPEHALTFARGMCRPEGRPPPPPPQDKNGQPPHPDRPDQRPLMVDNRPPGSQETRKHSRPDKPPPGDGKEICMDPGYLHTYTTRHPLSLLYIDGQSAAKSKNGVLDSQDLILLNWTDTDDHQNHGMFGEHDRAENLCRIAATKWEGRIDGFIRMEAGFEIILCDFGEHLHLVSAVKTGVKDTGRGGKDGGRGGGMGDMFDWFRAISARYDGVGENRVKIDYEHFVTAYAFPFDLFVDSKERGLEGDMVLPRLSNLTYSEREVIRAAVDDMVLKHAPMKPHRGLEHEDHKHCASRPQHEFPGKPEYEAKSGHHPPPPPPPGRPRRHHGDNDDLLPPHRRPDHHLMPPHHEPDHHHPPPHHPHPPAPRINWQATADLLVQRYTPALQSLPKFQNLTLLQEELESAYLRSFIDYSARDTAAEIEKCVDQIVPFSIRHHDHHNHDDENNDEGKRREPRPYHRKPKDENPHDDHNDEKVENEEEEGSEQLIELSARKMPRQRNKQIHNSHPSFPPSPHHPNADPQSLASQAITSLTHKICTTLFSLLPPPPSSSSSSLSSSPDTSFHSSHSSSSSATTTTTSTTIKSESQTKQTLNSTLSTLQDLRAYLNWSPFHTCREPCLPGTEFCFIPIWPAGTVEDRERGFGVCVNRSELAQHSGRGKGGNGGKGDGYWGDIGGSPGPRHEHE